VTLLTTIPLPSLQNISFFLKFHFSISIFKAHLIMTHGGYPCSGFAYFSYLIEI